MQEAEAEYTTAQSQMSSEVNLIETVTELGEQQALGVQQNRVVEQTEFRVVGKIIADKCGNVF